MKKAPDEIMTDWLNGNLEGQQAFIIGDFAFGEEAEFHALGDDGAIAKVKDQELNSQEVMAHLESGKYVTKLALDYYEKISFMLHDDLSIKRIKFSDVILEQNDDIDSDDKLARADTDFTLMAGELNRMINALHAEFSVKATDYLEG